MTDFISNMPKAELHVHLEGTLEPALARKLAERNGLPAPTSPAATPQPGQRESYPFHDLPSFLHVYYAAMSVLRKPIDFHDLVVAYLTKAHAQHVRHTEMFFDPQAHTSRGVPFEDVLSGLVSGVAEAKRTMGISALLIMCFLRDKPAADAMQTLDALLASPHRKDVVGVGLDSDEAGNPPSKFADVYKRAQNAGLRTTMHCDVDQVDSIKHIHQAVHDIGVERIDHGTNVVEDPALVQVLKQRGIGLTCCPLSNAVVCDDFKGSEMMQLHRQGVRVTINSDDPAYFNGYVSENVFKMSSSTDATPQELLALQRNAFEISWIGSELRSSLIQELDAHGSRYLGAGKV